MKDLKQTLDSANEREKQFILREQQSVIREHESPRQRKAKSKNHCWTPTRTTGEGSTANSQVCTQKS